MFRNFLSLAQFQFHFEGPAMNVFDKFQISVCLGKGQIRSYKTFWALKINSWQDKWNEVTQHPHASLEKLSSPQT